MSRQTVGVLEGRTALVTGSARGLGFHIAQGLCEAGAHVVLNGRDADVLKERCARLRANGGAASFATFDVTDTLEASHALETIAREVGGLDILINNAGPRDRRPLDAFSLDDLRDVLEAHVVAPFHLSRAATHHMAANGSGRIINVTSIAGPIARAGDVAYTTAKGALAAMTRALAAELGVRNITVNAIAPGYFATESNRAMVEDGQTMEWLEQRTSLKRWGKPEEIVGAAVFLASPAASYVTGQTVFVDGGYSSHF